MTTAFQNHKILYLNLPQSWKRTYIKYCNFKLGSGKTPSGGSAVYLDAGIALIRSLNVYDDGLRAEGLVYIDENTNYEMANTRLKENDVLLNITGASIGRSCIVPRWVLPANVNQHVCIIRPTKDVLSQYLAYVFKSAPIKDQINAYQQGSSREGLNFAQVGDLAFLLPPIPIQHQIASFLDRKTAAIDTLITKKQRLIQLLEEKRTALINQAVTTGLNPNVSMKDSRIPWIGRIPEHWKVKRFKYMISYLEQGWSPSCENRLVTEQEWGVLKVGCVNGGYFNELEHKALPSDLQPKLEYKIKTGDILVSRANTKELLGSAARVHVIKRKLLLCDKLYRLKTIDDVDPAFFVILMKSKCARYQFERDSSGASSSMQNISQESMRDFVLPLASIQEQQLIVDTLKKNFQTLNNLKGKLLKQIEKLQEYRQSLITAAVTGKIDIREEVAA